MQVLFILAILTTQIYCRETRALLVVNRHGARYSYSNKDPVNVRTELTRNGMRMSYLLGKWLRSRYGDFFSDKFHYSENMLIASSANRCRLSAQSIMLGIYDFGTLGDKLTVDKKFLQPQWEGKIPETTLETALPAGFTPIPIHSVTQNENFAYQSLADVPCPKLRKQLYSEDSKLDEKTLNAYNAFAKTLISDKFDFRLYLMKEKIENAYDLMGIVDYLTSMSFRGENNGFSEDTFKQIHRFEAATYYSFFFKNQLILKYSNTEFVRELVAQLELMKKAITADQAAKRFTLISGHDINIMGLLLAAEVAKTDCLNADGECTVNPPYSSAFTIEIYKENDKLMVETRLNDAPLAICQTPEKGHCTLDGFLEKLRSLMLAGEINELRDAFCREEKPHHVSRLPYLIAFNFLVAAVCGVFILKKRKYIA